MEKSTVSERIKQRRKELGMSYQELADSTGISKSTLQRYETGSIKNIPLDKLDVLAEGLQTTALYILGKSEQTNAEIINSGIRSVPVFDSVSAGFGAYADSRASSYIPTFVGHSAENGEYCFAYLLPGTYVRLAAAPEGDGPPSPSWEGRECTASKPKGRY